MKFNKMHTAILLLQNPKPCLTKRWRPDKCLPFSLHQTHLEMFYIYKHYQWKCDFNHALGEGDSRLLSSLLNEGNRSCGPIIIIYNNYSLWLKEDGHADIADTMFMRHCCIHNNTEIPDDLENIHYKVKGVVDVTHFSLFSKVVGIISILS